MEWAGKTGEHYVTNNREEYRQMWYAAIGGGLLTVGTAAIKLMVTHRGLPAFVEGFLAGLNYAVSFVLIAHFSSGPGDQAAFHDRCGAGEHPASL